MVSIDGNLKMRMRVLALAGILILATSLVLSFMLAMPEVRAYRECNNYSLKAFEGLLIYWGNYTLSGSLSNISLSITSVKETILNITYGISSEKPNVTTALSTFTYFIGNATYFYVYLIPYESTNLSVCLNALLTQQRSYLLLPTLILWVCGLTVTSYVALIHIEQVFRKGLKSKRSV